MLPFLFAALLGNPLSSEPSPQDRPTADEIGVADRPSSEARRFVAARAGEERSDNSLRMVFCWCPPGSFKMGNPADIKYRNYDEDPVQVTLSKGFWLGKTEVTQGQWKRVMKGEPWSGKPSVREGDNYAASYISWDDAVEFCRRFTEQERRAGRLPPDREYTLPTEAQWEYACRAGTTTLFYFGDNLARLGDYAWFNDNTRLLGNWYAHQVAGKLPNAWGLHDMPGNVLEWCRDWYHDELPGGVDPQRRNMLTWESRVLRGGAWSVSGSACDSADRSFGSAGFGGSLDGFRVALVQSGK